MYPDEVLVVHDMRQHDPADLTGIKLPGAVREQDQAMVGFGGTFLGGGA